MFSLKPQLVEQYEYVRNLAPQKKNENQISPLLDWGERLVNTFPKVWPEKVNEEKSQILSLI